ncbi:MAG: ribosomal L7Ae/L30e/S12e/Gadd45 family protein [Clostridia bacterium]|nr:ribosomal L7Ae/L30e/S12e/Gadd45 family protein [Clostridia bacterium]
MDSAYFWLGLSRKAGKIESGDAAVREALQRKKVCLLILASDGAARTVNTFQKLAVDLKIPWVQFGLKAELGTAIGKPPRTVLGITDPNLASGLQKFLQS